jgi:Acetoacetate decarboxylase (ADC)
MVSPNGEEPGRELQHARDRRDNAKLAQVVFTSAEGATVYRSLRLFPIDDMLACGHEQVGHMAYRFERGRLYRMPTHFGPAPGPRQMPPEANSDPSQSPHKTLVAASFLTDAAALDQHLPERFSLLGEPVVTVEFHQMTKIDWLAGRGYTMIHVWWPATFAGTQGPVNGRFLAVMWENLADPIISGREEIGHPKLYAEIPDLRISGGAYFCEARWLAFKFLELEVGALRDPVPANAPQIPSDGTLMLKYMPRTGEWGEADVCQVTFTPAGNSGATVDRRQVGTGAVRFRRTKWVDLPTMHHVVHALADLPVREARGGSVTVSHGGKAYLDQRVLM